MKTNFVLTTVMIFGMSIGNLAFAQSADIIPPTIPSGVSATNGGSGQIVVSWGASTDNVGVAGYYVYRNGALITNTSATTYTDFGLTSAVYIYTVVAYDAAGNLSRQSSSAFATAKIDTTAPTVPMGLSTTFTYHPLQIVFSWTASTDDIGVVGYYVYRNGVKIITTTAITGTTYTDTDITAGTSYSYTVQAYDLAGNISSSAPPFTTIIVSDQAVPSVPIGITAMATSATGIAVSWGPSNDNIGVAGYYIYRDGTQVGNDAVSSSLAYIDTGVSPGIYNYTVAAYDLAGNVSLMSVPANAKLVLDTSAPSAPFALITTALYPTQLTLQWNAAIDNVGVIGYNVYRDGWQIATVGHNFFSDTGLTASTTYSYTVNAHDVSGNTSTSSLPYVVTTPNASMIPPSAGNQVGAAVVVTSAPPGAPPVPALVTFTLTLYHGVRNSEVQALQNFLIQNGYLAANSATGYFGALTEQAVRKFQCDHFVVCTGSPTTTGWGMVGGRTRAALNSFSGGSTVSGSTNISSGSSTAQLTAQIQALQALLQGLQLQAQALHK